MWLLENKVLFHIHFELFHTNTCKATVNETLMEIRKIAKAFEAYALFSCDLAGEPANKPNAKKHFSRRVEIEDPQGADEAQINAFGSKKLDAKVMKCFNYSRSGHRAKECRKPKNKCPECQFLGRSHKKECHRSTAPGPLA